MFQKKNVKIETLGEWNEYANTGVAQALPIIYEHAKKSSMDAREWYWQSIKSKKRLP